MARLTQLAHTLLSASLRPGDLAIDATAGNGHDTLSLARAVQPGGCVLAVDRQARAIASTGQRLTEAGLAEAVLLREGNHADLPALAPDNWQGRVRAVVFNLGYLPGSDKACVTEPRHTVAALEAARALLAPGGALSVLIYRGHPGGHDEERAITDWLDAHPGDWTVQWHDGDFPRPDSPRLLWLVRRESPSAP